MELWGISVNVEDIYFFLMVSISNKDEVSKTMKINSLNFNSLKLESSVETWLDIFNKLENEETKPYFTNGLYNKFLFKEKYINIEKQNKNFVIIQKIIFKFINKINQLFEIFS